MKKIIVFITTLALLLCTTFTAYADDVYYGRYGEPGNSEALKTVSEMANEIYDNYEIDAFYFVTDRELVTSDEAKQFADSIISQFTNTVDTVSYVRGPEAGYIVTNGYCDEIFNQEIIARITGITSPFEIRDEYDNAAAAYFSTAYSIIVEHYGAGTEVPDDEMEQQPTGEEGLGSGEDTQTDDAPLVIAPASEAAPAKKGSLIKGLLICLVIGLIVAAIVISSIKSKYKPVHKNRAAANYLVDNSVQLTNSYENFVRKETTQREINNNQQK